MSKLSNTGDWNTGNSNTGNSNTGNSNTGNRNTGDWNTGDWNTGNRNTGDWNTGDWNTGDWNTGDWNTGDWNTGYFNNDTPKDVLVFGKSCPIKEWNESQKPNFIYFTLTEWVYSDDMSVEDKLSNPSHESTGGYLKSYEYQEAFKKSFDERKDGELEQLLELPNFNAEIFKDISGIDVTKINPNKSKIEEIEKTIQELQKQVSELKES